MNAVIIGANGQLGSDLVDAWRKGGHDVLPLTHEHIVVEDLASVRSVLGAARPEVVLNTAAFHNVPKCEQDPGRAYLVNAVGALNVARVSEELGAQAVYYSTDYVFDGRQEIPYDEASTPHPLNVYAASKLAGEFHTLEYNARGMVIRVSGIYGRIPSRAKGGNFVTTMVKNAASQPVVRVVRDEILCPTPTSIIADRSVLLVCEGGTGVFHLAVSEPCSWFEFASVIFAQLNLKTPLESCSVKEFPSSVKRPTYSVLENTRAVALGVPALPTWKDALTAFLAAQYPQAV